jgi:hypothetical protein
MMTTRLQNVKSKLEEANKRLDDLKHDPRAEPAMQHR